MLHTFPCIFLHIFESAMGRLKTCVGKLLKYMSAERWQVDYQLAPYMHIGGRYDFQSQLFEA
jgi:hypothetical protein